MVSSPEWWDKWVVVGFTGNKGLTRGSGDQPASASFLPQLSPSRPRLQKSAFSPGDRAWMLEAHPAAKSQRCGWVLEVADDTAPQAPAGGLPGHAQAFVRLGEATYRSEAPWQAERRWPYAQEQLAGVLLLLFTVSIYLYRLAV